MRTASALQPRAVKFGTSKPMNSGQSPPDLGRAPGFQSAGYNTTQDDHDGRISGTAPPGSSSTTTPSTHPLPRDPSETHIYGAPSEPVEIPQLPASLSCFDEQDLLKNVYNQRLLLKMPRHAAFDVELAAAFCARGFSSSASIQLLLLPVNIMELLAIELNSKTLQ